VHAAASDSVRPFEVIPLLEQSAVALLERLHQLLRTRGYASKTEDAYSRWVGRFLGFIGPLPASGITVRHVEQFLDYQTERALAPKSRNQAASALSFFLREVLGVEDVLDVPRARQPKTLPTVLSPREVERVFLQLSGKYRLIGMTIYGTGARVGEAAALRVKDVDFDLEQVTIRGGKGHKDRWVPLPDRIRPALNRQVERVEHSRRIDRKRGGGWAALPHALHRKDPGAGFRLSWQFLFPASRPVVDPKTDRIGRYHIHTTAIQRQIKRAGQAAGILKTVTPHTLRRTFATEMFRAGCDPATLQRLLGHNDIRTRSAPSLSRERMRRSTETLGSAASIFATCCNVAPHTARASAARPSR
jgi:integron integrase